MKRFVEQYRLPDPPLSPTLYYWTNSDPIQEESFKIFYRRRAQVNHNSTKREWGKEEECI